MAQFHKKYPTEESFAAAHPEDYNALQQFANGGKVSLSTGGEEHLIYKKQSPTGNGKGVKGHIMVNHPTMDKGKWDTIDLTDVAGAQTVAEGIAATKKWHAENPEYKNGGMIKRADGSYSQRGLWDSIRKNKGSGKKPTKQMLEQEAKIKAKYGDGGKINSIEEFNKKYNTNYKNLYEFTGVNDLETQDFFKGIQKVDPSLHYALYKQHLAYGKPNVTKKRNPLPFFNKSKASYNPLNNKIYLHDDKKLSGDKQMAEELKFYNNVDSYISELSHSAQNHSKNNPILKFATNDLPEYIKGNSPYKIKGTVENEAHSTIKPFIQKDVNQKINEYFDNANKYGNGGYVVKRSSERKGKTHVVIGPDGTKKYFGDSNLGQHPNDPERKKAFYARHKHNLANNPYFRAFARKTWAEGGEIDEEIPLLPKVPNNNYNAKPNFNQTQLPSDNTSSYTAKGNSVVRPEAYNDFLANTLYQTILDQNMAGKGYNVGNTLMTNLNNPYLDFLNRGAEAVKLGTGPVYDGLLNLAQEGIQAADKTYFPKKSRLEEIMKNKHADGGSIHIKPENKGKFTAWAKSHGMGVQEAASHVMANKDKYSSTIVKRANFAKNAAKFKHAEGGEVEPNNTFGLTGNYSRNPNPEAVESNYKLAADYQRKLGNFNAGLNANLGFNHTLPLNTDGFNGAPMIRPDANVGLNLNYDRNNSNFSGNFNYNPMNQGINAEVSYKKRFAVGGKIDEVYATSMQKTNNDGNTFVNAAYNVNPDGETSYQYNKQINNPNSTPYGINYFGNDVTGNQMSTYGPNGVNYFKADPIMNNFLENRSRSLSGGMPKYDGGGSTGLLQSYYDSQGGPGFKGGVFGSGYLKGDVNRLGYNVSTGLNLNPVMLGVGYGNMMGKDMPFVEGQITPSLGSFGSRRGPQGNVYGVAAGKYYADPNQMAALEKNLMDPNASAVMGRAGLGVNLKPSYRSKFGFSGEGGYDMVNDQPYFNAGVRYNIGDGGITNGCGRGPKHKSYGRLDFAEGGLMKYDMGGPTLKDIEAAKITTPAATTPKTGLTTYQGGMQKTPTGQSNAFSNNQFNLTDKLVTDYAKQHNLPTDNNANFQSAQLKMLQGTPQGQALLDKMNSTFGATKAGKYDDGILGARTQYLIQNDNIANSPKPNGYGQTWTKSIDANGNTVLTGRDGTVKVLPKKADSAAVANTLTNDMLTRRVSLATKAMGGTIGRSLKKYGDAGPVTTAGDATNPETTSNGMFEVVGKGKGWKNPNLASAGIGAGAQIAELALSKVPNNEYTDDEGNVVGSSTNTWAGIGKGAAQGAATGAALGPYGALAGAVIGGAMGYFNSAEEEEAAKKAQVASNNRISLKRIRGKANESAGLTQTMGTQLYPYGGSINTDQEGANAELELNEQFMLPGGEVGEVNGPSHDEGGIEVALPEGTKVFSDRLKLNGKTYAEHAKKINNKIRSLDRKPDSVAKANTEMLFNQQLNNLFNTQEEYKSQRDANFAQQFAQGGTIGSWEIIED